MEVVVDRCAGRDVHQKTVMACIRTPAPGASRISVHPWGETMAVHQSRRLRSLPLVPHAS
jgi:hypothetical protein